VRALNILGGVPRIFIDAYHSLKKKEKFMSCMRKSLAQAILNQYHIMKFSKQAQEYICAYHTIMPKEIEAAKPVTHLNDPMVTPMKIEKLVKEFKTHHCALDFDYSFIAEG
jgi:hypothetical protein